MPQRRRTGTPDGWGAVPTTAPYWPRSDRSTSAPGDAHGPQIGRTLQPDRMIQPSDTRRARFDTRANARSPRGFLCLRARRRSWRGRPDAKPRWACSSTDAWLEEGGGELVVVVGPPAAPTVVAFAATGPV